MATWPSSLSSAALVALALGALVCARPRSSANAGAATAPDATAPARPAQRQRIEDRSLLKVSFEVPAGWRADQRPGDVSLFSQSPAGAVIDLAYYRPRNQAQYDRWTRWTKEKLARLSASATIRRRQALLIDGCHALQLDWVAKGPGAPASQIVETWIARPFTEAPNTGEVFVVILEGAEAPAARAAYNQLLASLRFLPSSCSQPNQTRGDLPPA